MKTKKTRNRPMRILAILLTAVLLCALFAGCEAEVSGSTQDKDNAINKGDTFADGTYANKWLPDVDGTYGENPDGIFFFEPSGQYHEFINVTAHYSDIPMKADNPILTVEGN